MLRNTATCLLFVFILAPHLLSAQQWIRISQLGYPEDAVKTAVWCSKCKDVPATFLLRDAVTGKTVYRASTGHPFGAWGPFAQTLRLAFTAITRPGHYILMCGDARSPEFVISNTAYSGATDFLLNYMRQQRSGFNPFLQDSCHTGDGYTIYGPMPDKTLIDAAGGWHDASDYLQYVTTSANATYHLLAAWRDFPEVFSDTHLANGLPGTNGVADVLDEGQWGLQWLLKMNPRDNWLFNQLADDRDHAGFRLPNRDSADYGTGRGGPRPVYFITGEPQGLGKYKNNTTGKASAAGKFTSAFALGATLFNNTDTALAALLRHKAISDYAVGRAFPGVTQTAPNLAPYYYAEDNWTDDMELAAASLYRLTGTPAYDIQTQQYAEAEKVTPWMGADTARHYQWYPFHNFGHYELARNAGQAARNKLAGWYRDGIERVWKKAGGNAFYRELEQSCFDWLFGCNPWGAGMVYGLPADGITPKDPHSSLSVLNHYPLNGALLDGPVSGSIFNNLRGLTLFHADAYAQFQSSDLAVYHDDAGDYSTNEPTMDGTASLVYLMAQQEAGAKRAAGRQPTIDHGAITRGDRTEKKLALLFSADEFDDGGESILATLKKNRVKASFFLTGNFYRNPKNKALIRSLKAAGNFLGVHSDHHLLYCDWTNRDSLLVTHSQFTTDLDHAYEELAKFGGDKTTAPFCLPPYEWYNDSISAWTKEMGLQLLNFSPGARTNADYTYPAMGEKYVSSEAIFTSIRKAAGTSPDGLNGYLLLLHLGTDPRRTDKFYDRLPQLIEDLEKDGYHWVTLDNLLADANQPAWRSASSW
jgi:endoglucanase